MDYLTGRTNLNPSKSELDEMNSINAILLARVVSDLRLEGLLGLPVSYLSNGQGRRARIAKALLNRPAVLLLDEPFMGLDPPTVGSLSPLLHSLAEAANPRLILSARPQDPLPDWITHLVYLTTDCRIGAMGERGKVLDSLRQYVRGVWRGTKTEDESMPVHALSEMGRTLKKGVIEGEGLAEELAAGERDAEGHTLIDPGNEGHGEPLVEMNGCVVQYRGKPVLGNWTEERDGQTVKGLHWTVRRGERWGVFGPNGSGKTTIVSLLCSDHPQTYSLPIKLFGRSRLPEPGSGKPPLTFWHIQSRVGHSSPEVHQHMPRSLTIRQVLESAWADTFRSRPKLDQESKDQVKATLRWFARELNPERSSQTLQSLVAPTRDQSLKWADEYMFGELSFSAQRILLFLRAIIKHPDIVVLDEAFSGMDDAVRDKCMLFLAYGEEKTFGSINVNSKNKFRHTELPVVDSPVKLKGTVKVTGLSDKQALICISHLKEEVPDCVREWLCLPEAETGLPARFGRLDGPLRTNYKGWRKIWGAETSNGSDRQKETAQNSAS